MQSNNPITQRKKRSQMNFQTNKQGLLGSKTLEQKEEKENLSESMNWQSYFKSRLCQFV
jgi:hypothetical protein